MQPPKTVLLIDDDRDIHNAVRMILEPEGYRVESALTGPAGLEAARKLKPDLILLDVMLASPSEGFHLAYEMKRDEQLAHIPIVILSSIGETMGINYATELGSDYMPADAFVEKPFDPKGLREAVQRAISVGAK